MGRYIFGTAQEPADEGVPDYGRSQLLDMKIASTSYLGYKTAQKHFFDQFYLGYQSSLVYTPRPKQEESSTEN